MCDSLESDIFYDGAYTCLQLPVLARQPVDVRSIPWGFVFVCLCCLILFSFLCVFFWGEDWRFFCSVCVLGISGCFFHQG